MNDNDSTIPIDDDAEGHGRRLPDAPPEVGDDAEGHGGCVG